MKTIHGITEVEGNHQINRKLTEKITVTKSVSGRIEVHSKTIEGNFIDFGKNSKRTGLFIALFQKLATEYQQSGKLKELETEFEKENSWADYEIPSELPKPKVTGKPNLALSIIGGLVIGAIFAGIIFALPGWYLSSINFITNN